MALFDKKDCDICGGKIGMLGNRKLEDGNCCKDCANKLSPWMTGRRKTTVADIKDHLGYREANKQKLAQFNPTLIAGEDSWKVYADPNMGAFIVSRDKNWRSENADVIPLARVIACEIERVEHKKEVYQQMPDGSKKSYFPQRFDYSYDFKVHIRVDAPWFNEIDFPLNSMTVNDRYDPRYRQCEAVGDQIRSMLLSGQMAGAMPGMGMPFQQPMGGGFQQQPMQPPMQQGFQQQPLQPMPPLVQQPAQEAPAGNWFCQNCGTQNQGKFCQSCGTSR